MIFLGSRGILTKQDFDFIIVNLHARSYLFQNFCDFYSDTFCIYLYIILGMCMCVYVCICVCSIYYMHLCWRETGVVLVLIPFSRQCLYIYIYIIVVINDNSRTMIDYPQPGESVGVWPVAGGQMDGVVMAGAR